jgi:hypothetical protein
MQNPPSNSNPYAKYQIDYTRFRPDRAAEEKAKKNKMLFDFLSMAAPVAGAGIGAAVGAAGGPAGIGAGMGIGSQIGQGVGSMFGGMGDAQMDEQRRKAFERESVLQALSSMRGF